MSEFLIDETIDCLRPVLPPGSRLIVFGSHARGDARENSDLDLLVIEPEVVDRAAETVRLATLLGRRLVPADIVVMSLAAFETQRTVPNTLAFRVAHEGRVLELAG